MDADSFASDWNISGSSSSRLDRFDAFGNKDASAFPELGFQAFSDFNVNFSRQISQFSSLNGFIFGTFNASDTRARKDGFFPERANITYVDGEALIPLRLEFGDFFGFFTQRTIISTLKGVRQNCNRRPASLASFIRSSCLQAREPRTFATMISATTQHSVQAG